MALCSSSESSQSYRLPSRRVQTKLRRQPVDSDTARSTTSSTACTCTAHDATANPVHLPSRHAHPQRESRCFIPSRRQARRGYFEEVPLRIFDAPGESKNENGRADFVFSKRA